MGIRDFIELYHSNLEDDANSTSNWNVKKLTELLIGTIEELEPNRLNKKRTEGTLKILVTKYGFGNVYSNILFHWLLLYTKREQSYHYAYVWLQQYENRLTSFAPVEINFLIPDEVENAVSNDKSVRLKIDELLNLNMCDYVEHLKKSNLTEFEMVKWIEHNCTSDEQLSLLHLEIENFIDWFGENEVGALPYVRFLIENRKPKLFKDGHGGHNGQDIHFTRSFNPNEQKKLFDGLINGGFLYKRTIKSHFLYVFGGKEVPENEMPFKPLIWVGSIKELNYFINKYFRDEKYKVRTTIQCFLWNDKPIKENSFKTAIDKYDNLPDKATIIDDLLN
jgi:hypothetical protein